MPLHFSDEELTLLTSLAQPLDHRHRDQFLLEVAAELEAGGQAGAVGVGSIHRVGRMVQRRFFDRPNRPSRRRGFAAPKKGEVPTWNITGEAAIIGLSSVLASSRRSELSLQPLRDLQH